MTKTQHKKVLQKLKWLDQFAFEVLNNPKIRIDRTKPQQGVIIYCMAKLHTSFGASMELIKSGFGIDAMIIVRSMINNLINMLWIANKASKRRSTKFIDYHKVLRKEYLDKVKKNYPKESWFGGILKQEKEILESYKKVEYRFTNRYKGWSGFSIKERAEEVKKYFDYEIVYFLASSIEHSDIYASKDFIDENSNEQRIIHFKGGPSTAWVMESAITSVKYLGEGIEFFIKTFRLDKALLKKLNRFGKRFSKVAAKK